jgi:hypothetical protein
MKKFILTLSVLFFINIIIWWNLGFSIYPRSYIQKRCIENVDKSKFIKTKNSCYYLPDWVDYTKARINKKNNKAILYIDKTVLGIFNLKNLKDISLLKKLTKNKVKKATDYKVKSFLWVDKDNDSIPDSLDIQLGMYKTVQNKASYKDKYMKIKFPYGDVPLDIGVCTDVVIRSFLNAGISLQKQIYNDMAKRKKSYGKYRGKKPDSNIEHRRVRRLIVLFKKYYKQLNPDFKKSKNTKNQYLPGDVVFMSLIPDEKKISHIGIISANRFISFYPLLIHNTAKGFHTAEMDILWFQKIKYRFRPYM